jgi:hypothetical protein
LTDSQVGSIKLLKQFNLKLFSSLFIVFVSVTSVIGQDKTTTHYLFPEFYTGKVLMKTGNIEESRLNYNSLTEEMIFETKGKYLALTNIGLIDTVYIQNRKFIPVGKVFYEVPVNMKMPLLIKHTCRVIPPGNPTAYGGTSETTSVTVINILFQSGRAYNLKLPDDYKINAKTDFYLKSENNYIRINKVKQVIKCFPEKEREIKEFVKLHKTDFDNKEDLIDLIIFCNK